MTVHWRGPQIGPRAWNHHSAPGAIRGPWRPSRPMSGCAPSVRLTVAQPPRWPEYGSGTAMGRQTLGGDSDGRRKEPIGAARTDRRARTDPRPTRQSRGWGEVESAAEIPPGRCVGFFVSNIGLWGRLLKQKSRVTLLRGWRGLFWSPRHATHRPGSPHGAAGATRLGNALHAAPARWSAGFDARRFQVMICWTWNSPAPSIQTRIHGSASAYVNAT